MEGELWDGIYQTVATLTSGSRRKRQQFSDRVILWVYLWAVLHDRPVSWSCREDNWAGNCPGSQLPSAATMSRRLRSRAMAELMNEVEQQYRRRFGQSLCKWMDALPLPIGNSSGDRQARYGRAGNGKAKGYKFYALYDPRGAVEAWRVCPMNVSEKKMARRMVRDVEFQGYLVGDGVYDDNALYEWTASKGIVLLVPKRKGKALGHQWQSRHRLRAIERLSQPFAQEMIRQRAGIDRFFGSWACWSLGIKHLPAWVRGIPRVRRWVQGKLILLYAWRANGKQALTA
jgi:hypothetical protein